MTDTIGREFMRKSSHSNARPSPQSQGVPLPPLEVPYPPDAPLLHLPQQGDLPDPAVPLRTFIQQRVTVRKYRDQPLSVDELAYLLWCTQGVKVIKRSITLRTVPSAGARHAFETYLLVNKVSNIKSGLYRYLALEHALLRMDFPAEICEQVTDACLHQKHVADSAVTFLWVAVTERMEWGYPDRGYRYLHLDAGHVCQNLYLAAESIDCGVCAIAAFDDDALNQAVRVDGESMFVIYAASLGKKTGRKN